jgi:hypothetical protein
VGLYYVDDEYSGNEDISESEVKNAIQRLKNGKAAGIDDVKSELLKYGGETAWMEMKVICESAWNEGIVPCEWKKAIIKPLYKGKGARSECKNSRAISLLSVAGKVYARIIIDRISKITESKIGEEQSGFREGRGCIEQIFIIRQLVEKYLEKGKKVYAAFMDLEKAYDKVSRTGLWKVLEMYGVGGKLLDAVMSFYDESYACVRVGEIKSDWFAVNEGLRQGCVMSPWLFNIYMDGVMREMMVDVGDIGLHMENSGNVFCLQQVLYADDTGFLSESEVGLSMLVEIFENVCNRRLLKVNGEKSKVIVFNLRAKEGQIVQ